MYICIYVYMYICICIYVFYVYVYMCIYVYMYICKYVNMYICMYVCMYECMYVCMCVYVYIYMYIYIRYMIYVYSFLTIGHFTNQNKQNDTSAVAICMGLIIIPMDLGYPIFRWTGICRHRMVEPPYYMYGVQKKNEQQLWYRWYCPICFPYNF